MGLMGLMGLMGFPDGSEGSPFWGQPDHFGDLRSATFFFPKTLLGVLFLTRARKGGLAPKVWAGRWERIRPTPQNVSTRRFQTPIPDADSIRYPGTKSIHLRMSKMYSKWSPK